MRGKRLKRLLVSALALTATGAKLARAWLTRPIAPGAGPSGSFPAPRASARAIFVALGGRVLDSGAITCGG